ncbi:MAG: chaperone NapD [Candidatus Accumulibacter sp.]|nr:chaperone NapD [Accumulibacter sp.]
MAACKRGPEDRLLVNARAEVQQQVHNGLLPLDGVQFHAATENGQMIVTIEADSDRRSLRLRAESHTAG